MPLTTASIVSVADAVVAAIEVARTSLSQQEFDLERNYADWSLDLVDASPLRVDVVPVSTKQESILEARGRKLKYVCPIDIAIRKKFGQEHLNENTGRLPNAVVDELVLFTQEIHELFTQLRFTGFTAGVVEEDPKLLANPVLKHLREYKQFTSVVRLTFRVERAL